MSSSSNIKACSSLDAWAILSDNPDTILVDVRTMVEWAYVGIPDLTSINKKVVTIEWSKMTGQQNAAFSNQLKSAVPLDKTLLFICRGGVRSHSAAIAAQKAGYENILNVEDGFDGELDEKGQRKSISGWCVSGLPWTQS